MIKENGVIAGNIYDKYTSKNPIEKYLMQRFIRNILDLIEFTACQEIHEVGCGEGHLSGIIKENTDIKIKASDFSENIIKTAVENYPTVDFQVRDIYKLYPVKDSACLIICSEVLEHIKNPVKALEILSTLNKKYILITVPREPIWRAMNIARGKYIANFGNTPGHINHWSKRGFIKLVSYYFGIVDMRTPFPWTILLCGQK
jgi:2-polyprenyl-3-methyl-5-hydroxy-6-metoxy-1,4-benzoquinol methylase